MIIFIGRKMEAEDIAQNTLGQLIHSVWAKKSGQYNYTYFTVLEYS